MHERKTLMADLSGDYGTLEEIIEIVTWQQMK